MAIDAADTTADDAESPLANYGRTVPSRGAWIALALLLAINLFNYIDRYVLGAVLHRIGGEFFNPTDPTANTKLGYLTSAFLVSYMCVSPLFGWLGDRAPRWRLIGIGVIIWSLASGASGLAGFYMMMLLTRVFVGIGEAAYGPVAPTIISDLYPVASRGKVLSLFYAAIPVGSALGYVLGLNLAASRLGWRWAFFLVVPPGILLGLLCFFMPEPPRGRSRAGNPHARIADYFKLLRIPSYVIDTIGATAMTFAIGGIAVWMPFYLIEERHLSEQLVGNAFGGIVVVAGLAATLAGGWVGDALRSRVKGSYFVVSGAGMLMGFPFFLLILVTPFPLAWVFLFLAVFFLFFNTGPSNAILANVTPSSIRATAFALNIFVIHLFGDVTSPPIIGWIRDRNHGEFKQAFGLVSAMMVLGGLVWLWGARYLERDTEQANNVDLSPDPAFPVVTAATHVPPPAQGPTPRI